MAAGGPLANLLGGPSPPDVKMPVRSWAPAAPQWRPLWDRCLLPGRAICRRGAYRWRGSCLAAVERSPLADGRFLVDVFQWALPDGRFPSWAVSVCKCLHCSTRSCSPQFVARIKFLGIMSLLISGCTRRYVLL